MSLPLLIVISALCVAVAAAAVASSSFYAQTRRQIEADLTIQARDKRDAVQGLIDVARKSLINTAGSHLVRRALDGLAVTVKIMPPEARPDASAQVRAEVDDKPLIRGLTDYYGRAYDGVHPLLRALASDIGADDALFITPQAIVAYTVAKRSDFLADVHSEALANSVLASVFDQAATMRDGGSVITDVRFYAPAGRPTAFIGTPVFDRDDFLGVLIVELPSRPIDAVLNDPHGFGERGEAVVVGADGALRSTSRLGPGGDALLTRFEEPRLLKPPPDGAVGETSGYLGQRTIVAAIPLMVPGLHWTVLATEDADELMRPVWDMLLRIGGICLAVTLALAALAAWAASRIAGPVLTLMERFDGALSNMPHGLVMIDSQRRIILCNTAYRDMYALPASLMQTGTSLDEIDQHRRRLGMAPVEPSEGSVLREERRELADGRTIDVMRKALPSGGYVATHQNVTTAIRAQREIAFLASHDSLTQLPNRAAFGERIAQALASIAEGEMLAVHCLDLDHFKTVNDTLGHPVGDQLLTAVAGRLGHDLRPADVLARIGGDEFVILQCGLDAPDQASQLAQRLIDKIGAPFQLDGQVVVVGLSVGIAIAPADGIDADTLLRNADLALYRAKDGGRGQAQFFEPGMDADMQERRRLELDLRMALANREFTLAYQPQFDADSQTMTGVEALLRWCHPERGFVPPSRFVPIAEDRGLIVSIGEWVIRRACADAAAWPDDIRVAVNLSALQLKSPGLADMVAAILAETGLSPLRLELEITESVLLGEDETTLSTLHALKRMGLRIAMDDFGTGYSSLSYLRSFPFDKIKIDQSFVRELADRKDAIAIIRAIADLSATLGMTTTAEGIETAEQLDLVRNQGCDEVQGYLLCRPTTAEAIGRMIQQRTSDRRRSA